LKPTKIRNQQIYRATYAVRSKQISGSLSKELRKKYGKRSVRINVDDTVRIIRGEYKGIDGKVTKVSTEKNGVAIEGIKKEKLKGEKIDVYIPSSNVLIIGLNTADHWRKSKLEGNKPKSTPKEVKSEKPKEVKSEKPKEVKSEKPKEVQSEKPKEVQSEKPKEVQSEKPKEVQSEKPKEVQSKNQSKIKTKEAKE
jgi:large subunit ribosomal protein L24